MYKKLKEMQAMNDMIFKLAIDQVLSMGTENALQITDKDIEDATIPLFDDSLARLLYEMIRELARCEKQEFRCIFKFIQTEKMYNIKDFKKEKKNESNNH